MSIIETIESNETYQQILSDSCGGIMYNVKNIGKYDNVELLRLWRLLLPSEKEACDGTMKGVFDFILGN